jgi:hypothetical protein
MGHVLARSPGRFLGPVLGRIPSRVRTYARFGSPRPLGLNLLLFPTSMMVPVVLLPFLQPGMGSFQMPVTGSSLLTVARLVLLSALGLMSAVGLPVLMLPILTPVMGSL